MNQYEKLNKPGLFLSLGSYFEDDLIAIIGKLEKQFPVILKECVDKKPAAKTIKDRHHYEVKVSSEFYVPLEEINKTITLKDIVALRKAIREESPSVFLMEEVIGADKIIVNNNFSYVYDTNEVQYTLRIESSELGDWITPGGPLPTIEVAISVSDEYMPSYKAFHILIDKCKEMDCLIKSYDYEFYDVKTIAEFEDLLLHFLDGNPMFAIDDVKVKAIPYEVKQSTIA